MPLIETKGAASAQGFGGAGAGASGPVTYIEDVFSTWLYTGNSSTQTITNGIDLSGKGGMIWTKSRSGSFDHAITDSTRYLFTPQQWYRALNTNTTAAEWGGPGTTVNSTGYSLTGDFGSWWNESGYTYASWTFRKQPKFFDIVTYTGNGSTSGRTISHNLGSVPGCIIVKKTSSAEDWYVYHRSLGNTGTLQYFCILNSTAAQDTGGFGMEKASNWTATQFALASGTSALNTNGETYVAYLFAHNAGGFGTAGTDNVISCGSFTTDGSGNATVTLGWEPQFVLYKSSSNASDWELLDTMRGMPVGIGGDNSLRPNDSSAEFNIGSQGRSIDPTATGFTARQISSWTFIYIAIRRGPMKVPTSGTSVFVPATFSTASGASQLISSPTAIDMGLLVHAPVNGVHYVATRLIGNTATLQTQTTSAESTTSTDVPTPTNQNAFTNSMSFRIEGSNQTYWNSTATGINCFYGFRRAPGFFDVVCYTGNGSLVQTLGYNLGVSPEMIFIKNRSATTNWSAIFPASGGGFNGLPLNSSGGGLVAYSFSVLSTTQIRVFDDPHTAGGVSIGADNTSANNYVAYLFATCAGVSKVGSYTGTGALQTINCGFTGGARFVLIKRTDSTGDWYVYDSARGISSGNDPYLFLNSTAAEVTGTNYVDTTSVGFQVTAAAPAGLNANGGTYIFLAIA